ncbi:hypothetical protein [Streptomyces pseudovenezuelae]|uniref:Uncharacterized protein n=1 Tax=Streptomyces pseudovenezuelae TaxID=67350 RepID=A0ABT6M1G3_9ACTN|nr:hypothetical protein [Streptomyces pseudovenezuelae]MDH6222399.1 hypothetical protein [Streptomyces pseudovenezuelae]
MSTARIAALTTGRREPGGSGPGATACRMMTADTSLSTVPRILSHLTRTSL